jgi:hypothetical protein
MPATLTKPKAPARLADDPRYKAELAKLASIKADLTAVRERIAALKAVPVGDATEAAAAAIVAGVDYEAAAAAARDELAEAQKRELALVRAVEIQQCKVGDAQRDAVRQIHAALQSDLLARLAAVATAVSQIGVEIELLGEFLDSAAEAGAPLPESAWGVVLGHASDDRILTLPVPAQVRRAMRRYVARLKGAFPDLAADLNPLIADWS